MWRTKFLFQILDCSSNSGHINAMLSPDCRKNMGFNQVDKRKRNRGFRCRLDHRFEKPSVGVRAVRHAGSPRSQSGTGHQKIMRSLGNSVRRQFSNILLVRGRHRFQTLFECASKSKFHPAVRLSIYCYGARQVGSRRNSESFDSCAPAHLKLVRFPAYSPLPIAALPSMSLFPKVPFELSVCNLCRGLIR